MGKKITYNVKNGTPWPLMFMPHLCFNSSGLPSANREVPKKHTAPVYSKFSSGKSKLRTLLFAPSAATRRSPVSVVPLASSTWTFPSGKIRVFWHPLPQ